ncbi:ATP-binding protein [Gilvimarinus sp. F26214L]|uniref:ATP-binding protein n=1 Tax=Gilvimarinus sp. DZF01 TaxID=3461371 RepID=UPI0040461D8A
MFLKRGIFVNWGNIPQLEFEFGPINLFSGGNGSGKTTAADAIQTLMTAAHENLFNYNPGQDETTQRGRGGKQVRTLASYVLGCDDGSYSRPWPTDAYVAGIFHPTQGESGEVFTAVMCMRAHLDGAGTQKQARLAALQFLIIPGEQLCLDDLIKEYPDGKHVVPIDSITGLLKKRLGSKTVEVYDKKGAYLRRLYGALRGRRDAVSDREAKHAARTFANFMAYKPVKSITEFVAREVLEPKDLGEAIRAVSELMKTIHQMEADTRAIRDTIDTLDNARTQAQRYVDTWVERSVLQYTEATRRLQLNHHSYVAAKKAQQDVRAAIADNQERLTLCEQRRQQSYDERVQLEARRQGVGALKDKDDLERAITERNRELGEKARPLLESGQQIARNVEATQTLMEQLQGQSLAIQIPALDGRDFRQQAKAIASGEDLELDFNRLLSRDWVGMERLEEDLDRVLAIETRHRHWAETLHGDSGQGSVRDQIALVRSSCERRWQDLQGKLRQKEKEVRMLETRKVSYPPQVEAAVAAIRKACPDADPRVLCDYVEVTDPAWQMAIEGYIGGARFSILVETEYEAEAIRIVRSMPGGRRSNARVIQGSKVQRDAERLGTPKGSIIEVMAFTHRTAEFYLRASYGNVLCVGDADALRNTVRGVTPEGLGSGGYSMWRCDLDDSELVFGQAARERAMRAKERECEQLAIDANQAERELQTVSQLFGLVESIKPVQCSGLIRGMLQLQRQITQAESELAQLDLSDFRELEEQLEQLKQQYAEQETLARQLSEESGSLKQKEQQHETEIRKLADAQDALQQVQDDLESAIEQTASAYPELNAEEVLQQAEQRARSAGRDHSFNDELETLGGQLENIERTLFQSIREHNQRCNQHDAIVYDNALSERHSDEFFQRVVKLRGEIDLIHNRLKNNVLVDKFDKLTGLKESFNTAFVTNLCHSIYQAIGEGKRILDDLNRELEHHRFGADRERFYFGYDWVPEYKDYWRFFKEIIDQPNLGDGASLFEAELSTKARQVRDRMLDMLLDPDEQIALRELGRISDYRNYRRYEIYKEPEGKAPIALSQYGTGSGGQLETPAYIIRSAAVTSAFRFNEGSSHLRMVLVDEAFSKMDETRSREVINYLTETLGLQLLFIMPTSKSGPFMDLISNQFVFSKCPTTTPIGELNTRVLVDRKACNQDRIKELWANHRKTVKNQAMLDFMEDLA